MRIWIGWYLSAILVLASASSYQERRDTASNINNGLSLAKALGDAIVSKNFTNALGDLAKTVTPFLGIAGPLVQFVLGFLDQPESAELQAIKQLAKDVNARFDKVDLEFAEIKNLIDWSKTQIQFHDIEQKITAVSKVYSNIFSFSTAAVNTTTSAFITNYESDYQNSGAKLYDGIMNEGRLFGDGLLSAITARTEYHRRKVRNFMLGLLKLMMEAAKIELAYHQLKGHTSALADYQRQWHDRIMSVRSKILSVDHTVTAKYHDQSGIDIDHLLTKYPKSQKNNNDFNTIMYNFLVDKYDWRDWMTITYNDIAGGDLHWVHECNGHIKFRASGRNVVVASVNKNTNHVYMDAAKTIINGVHAYSCDTRVVFRPFRKTIYHRLDAHTAFNAFPSFISDHCSPYAAEGVIRYEDDVHFKGPSDRLYVRSQEHCNHVFIFG